MEDINILTNHITCIETGIHRTQSGFMLFQQVSGCLIDIGDFKIPVNHHHRLHCTTNRRAQAGQFSFFCIVHL